MLYGTKKHLKMAASCFVYNMNAIIEQFKCHNFSPG